MKPGNRQRIVEMVPIPTKRIALADEREATLRIPFCFCAERDFLFVNKKLLEYESLTLFEFF